MKRFKCIFAFVCCMIFTQSVMAQLNSVQLSMNGSRARFVVTVEGLGEVVVDTYGNVVRVVDRDNADYDTSYNDVRYEYYSNFNSYEAGKIKSIGNVVFTYYSNFNDYEAAKIKTIAGKSVKYYSTFNDYEAGKIKSVAGVNIDYYSNFNDYEAGKIKSIGNHKYEYFSGFGSNHNVGQPKSGYAKVKVNGVNFMINNRLRK